MQAQARDHQQNPETDLHTCQMAQRTAKTEVHTRGQQHRVVRPRRDGADQRKQRGGHQGFKTHCISFSFNGVPAKRLPTNTVATTASAKPSVTISSGSPNSGTAARMLKNGCSNCVWLTFSAPPNASPRYQAKNPAHIENTPTYTRPHHADGRMACAGQVNTAPGKVSGSAITQTQQI